MNENKGNKPPIVIVSGMSRKNRAIGKNNELLWHVPADLKRFKQLTMGHPVIMGQKTFESILEILGKPFPGRTNIVLTLDKDFSPEGENVKVAYSIPEAIEVAESENPAEIHIGGGGQVYKQMLPLASRLHITWFFDEKEGDTFFPDFENEFEVEKEYPVEEHDGIKFQWVDYMRKQ
ncbi:dihydrofolate reductase [Candidatus Kaiserbacteria bacterium]|nr:dihydrofolate reductase [Candidatus Kaiserbacteria bacterium]USN92669.1 MAG: dihydrofolate reductase [Candidatus Nomurabacteria bacterium]